MCEVCKRAEEMGRREFGECFALLSKLQQQRGVDSETLEAMRKHDYQPFLTGYIKGAHFGVSYLMPHLVEAAEQLARESQDPELGMRAVATVAAWRAKHPQMPEIDLTDVEGV